MNAKGRFLDTQNLKELITSKPILEGMLKKVLQAEGKRNRIKFFLYTKGWRTLEMELHLNM